jgi:D-alanine-D-alanine ligase
MMQTAEKAHKLLNCKGITRVEFIYDEEVDKTYFLEINTHPGLTATSFVPDILQNNGISLTDLFKNLINEALK